MRRTIILITCVFGFGNFFFSHPALAHRPLTTQSAYPLEIHRIKLESGIRYTNFPKADEAYGLDIELNYGIINNLDVGIEVPYLFWQPENEDNVQTVGDMILKSRLLFLKGREGNPISLTIQPFFKVPTPKNDTQVLQSGPGLSTGETDFGFVFIATREIAPIVAHMNLGYTFINKPSFGRDYENVFSFKLAVEYEGAKKGLELVGELNGETNKDPSGDDLLSVLLGARFVLKEGVSADVGYGIGVSDASPDSTATMGLTMDF
ncbi:MAG: transporter [Nitrospirae bacterium]|nr:transporter [Nitrospirota bacterium]